jgi:hypothetical protein
VSEVYPETPLSSPVVVSGPPAPPPAAPGQRAYEAHAAMVVPRPWRWDHLDDKLRAAWEAAAQAAIAAAATATPLPKFLGHPDDLADKWLDESYELDQGDPAWDREDMQSAYREGRDEARRQLAPAWAAMEASLAQARRELAEARAELFALRELHGHPLVAHAIATARAENAALEARDDA